METTDLTSDVCMPKKDRSFFGKIMGGNLVDDETSQSAPTAVDEEMEELADSELLMEDEDMAVEEEVVIQAAPASAPAEPVAVQEQNHEEWLSDYEGQLNIDMYQTKDNVIIKSTIAGVRPEDMDITVANDMVTIKGARKREETVSEDDYFYQECYWGNFSRSVIVPVDIDSEHIEADLKDGILTVVVPKAAKAKTKKIKVKGI
jgi:HSP20 family protein